MNSSGRFPRSLFVYLFICLFVYLFIGLFVPQVMAQGQDWVGTGYGTNLDDARLNGALNSDSYVTDVTYDNIAAIACAILPTFGPNGCTDNQQVYGSMLRGSAIASMTNVIALTFSNPPANTYAFIQETGQSLGFLPKKALAQGIGFSGLAPLLPIWKAFRNISYVLLAAIMVVVGFMVMLRKKIDPKTVVTIQNALPRIVVTLIVITFSYAIVGIMIDLMYLAILIAVAIFKSTGMLPEPHSTIANLFGTPTVEALYSQGSLWANISQIDFNPYKLVFGINAPPLWTNLGLGVVGLLMAVIGSSSFALGLGPAGAIPGLVLLGTAGGMFLIQLLIAIAAFFLLIRLLFFFLGAYIKIIIALVFGPIQIMIEAIPGSNAFSSWFMNLLSNIIVFPAGAVMFMLSAMFVKFSDSGGTIWNPPFAGFLGNSTASISTLIAIGILFAIPGVVNGIQEAIKAKPLFSAGPEGVAGALAHPLQIGFQVWQFLHSREQTKLLRELPKKMQEGG